MKNNIEETKLIVESWRSFLNDDVSFYYDDKESIDYEKKLYEGKLLEEGFSETLMNWVQVGFDIAGFIPILGEGFDAINAIISLSRGRPVEAMLSIISCFPTVGDAIGKTGKALLYFMKKVGVDNALEGKIKDINDSKNFHESSNLERNIFYKTAEIVINSKNKWWPLIDNFLTKVEKVRKDEYSVSGKEIIDDIEHSGIKTKVIPESLREKVGEILINKMKVFNDPEKVRKGLENVIKFLENSIKNKKV